MIIPSFNGYTSVKSKATLDRAFIFAAPILRNNTPTVEIWEDLTQLTVLRVKTWLFQKAFDVKNHDWIIIFV